MTNPNLLRGKDVVCCCQIRHLAGWIKSHMYNRRLGEGVCRTDQFGDRLTWVSIVTRIKAQYVAWARSHGECDLPKVLDGVRLVSVL